MTNTAVFVRSLEYDTAVEVLHRGTGRLIPTWDAVVWRYWIETAWDQRPRSELETQPGEIAAYAVDTPTLRHMGVEPLGQGPHIVFVWPEVQWAMVASNGPLFEA
jgi:hypothetical protein